jgi:hypothetical protein
MFWQLAPIWNLLFKYGNFRTFFLMWQGLWFSKKTFMSENFIQQPSIHPFPNPEFQMD